MNHVGLNKNSIGEKLWQQNSQSHQAKDDSIQIIKETKTLVSVMKHSDKKIELNGITEIQSNALIAASGIEEVILSKELEKIQSQAFKNCKDLKNIYKVNL